MGTMCRTLSVAAVSRPIGIGGARPYGAAPGRAAGVAARPTQSATPDSDSSEAKTVLVGGLVFDLNGLALDEFPESLAFNVTERNPNSFGLRVRSQHDSVALLCLPPLHGSCNGSESGRWVHVVQCRAPFLGAGVGGVGREMPIPLGLID